MASGEGVGGLEALFAADTDGDGSPELAGLRERLRGWLSLYEPAVLAAQSLLVWERPLRSVCVALGLHAVFWLLSSTPLRPVFLISVSLISLVLLERWKHKLPSIRAEHPESHVAEREGVTERPRLLSVAELSHHLAESYVTFSLYVQEMLQYKQQNHGKFCVVTCAGCLVLAVVGHYVPGVMISYIVLLSVLLWPLVVYHELIQKMYTGLEPVLMKLDYSMKGGSQHRKHEKRKVKKETDDGGEPQAEMESESEEELSCLAVTVDMKTAALALAITDSELSDEEASILESGGFSVSRATTPQLSDMSEDLDQQCVTAEPEVSFSKEMPEFPLTERVPPAPLNEGTDSDPQDVPQSPESLLVRHLASPLHFVNTHFNGHFGSVEAPGGPNPSLEALGEEIVKMAISSVVQDTLSALLSSDENTPGHPQPSPSNTDAEAGTPDVSGLLASTSSQDADEDFEILDQSELESTDRDQGLSSQRQGTEARATQAMPTPSYQSQES